MDWTVVQHTIVVVVLTFIFGGLGLAFGSALFIAREHTQAEYRWIAKYGEGKRANMPWWGGFDVRVWDIASLLDWAVPLVVGVVSYWLLDSF